MTYHSIDSQAETLLRWFFDNQVMSVDIHLRCPNTIGVDYKSDDWTWITKHEHLSYEKALHLLPWCRNRNANGSDIFIRPHRFDKQAILFLDDLSIHKAKMITKKYRSIVVETSSDNTQVWLALARMLDVSERKLAQQYISNLGLTDRGSISGDHLGRLCGYKSQKRNYWVKYFGQSHTLLYDPVIAKPSTLPHGGHCAKNISRMPSQSERDFSWVLSNARKGLSSVILTKQLTLSASERGKPAPEKYASRTVRKAMQVLT